MSVITKTIQINLHPKMAKYYESLGYTIPRYYNIQNRDYMVKRGTKIIVSVKDLPKGSNIKIETICDFCGRHKMMQYNTYTRYNHNGKNYCQKCYAKLFHSGDKCPAWNPLLTKEDRIHDRNYPSYKIFIKKVLARDNYTCQCCGDKNTNHDIVVHHLNSYNWFKDGRTDETNAITLCNTCHSNFHATYGNGNNTKEQFEEWIGRALDKLTNYEGYITSSRQIYCLETNKIYDSAVELAKEYSCKSMCEIYYTCGRKKKTFRNLHLYWLDEYEKMTPEDISAHIEWSKNNSKVKVICLNNHQVFESIVEAMSFCKLKKRDGIVNCCRNRQKYSGKHPITNEKLQWMYYEDYLKQKQ